MRKLMVTIGIAVIAAAAVLLQSHAQDTVDVSTLPFSSARQAGNTLYVSGQIAVKPDGTSLAGKSVAEQTHQTMKNLGAALADYGYTWDDVVKVTVYLDDMDYYDEMNAAYRTYFDGAFPARECIGGVELALGLDMEISCIAYKE